MSQDQLDDYRAKFLPGEFERYFLNLWSAGTDKIFTEAMMDGVRYIGVDNQLAAHVAVDQLVTERVELKQKMEDAVSEGVHPSQMSLQRARIALIENRLLPLENVYRLKEHNRARMSTLDDLARLGDLYDTNWVVMAGIDRADPMKETMRGARTIVSFIAKGLRGSRSNPLVANMTDLNPMYIYFMLHLAHIETSSIEDIKDVLLKCHEEYLGLDLICGDRWGIWDLQKWTEENDILFEAVHPTYDKQKLFFTEFYNAIKTGRFKCPPLGVWGTKEDDILREEALIFQHDADKRWFGSPEKEEKDGIQDDAMYSTAICIYGGRILGYDEFRKRNMRPDFGLFVGVQGNLGMY
jgi:hypothetical protein